MPKTQEKIKVLRGTRANIAAVAASAKASKFKLAQGELALDVTDGYLIAGLSPDDISGNPTNDIDDTKHIIKTNELVGYKNDADGTIAPENTYDKLPDDATFDEDETYYQFNSNTNQYEVVNVTSETFDEIKSSLYTLSINNRGGEYSVRFTDSDNKLTIKNENGDIDTTAYSSVNVTAQNGNITETASGEVNVTAQGGDVNIKSNSSNPDKYVKLNEKTKVTNTGRTVYIGDSAVDGEIEDDDKIFEDAGIMLDDVNDAARIRNKRYKIEYSYEPTEDTEVVEGKKYYSKSGDVYTEVNQPTGNPQEQEYYEKVHTYESYFGSLDIDNIKNLGKVKGELASGSTTIKTLLNKIGSDSNKIEGIEFETNTAGAQSNPKKSTIRTDKLETDTIKSRAETDLDIQSKGNGKVIKLNTNTTISENGQTLKVDNGKNETGDNANHHTQITPENTATDSLNVDTITKRKKAIDITEVNKVNGSDGDNLLWEKVRNIEEVANLAFSTDDVTITYQVGDLRKYSTNYYRCKENHDAPKSTEIPEDYFTTRWSKITDFSDETDYPFGDYCIYPTSGRDSDKYICKYNKKTNSKLIKLNDDDNQNPSAAKVLMDSSGSTIYSDKYIGKLNTSSNTSPKSPGEEFKMLREALLDMVYPVGSIYMSKKSDNPGTFLGGTWKRIKDYFLYAGKDGTHTYDGDKYPGDASGSNDGYLLEHDHSDNFSVDSAFTYKNNASAPTNTPDGAFLIQDSEAGYTITSSTGVFYVDQTGTHGTSNKLETENTTGVLELRLYLGHNHGLSGAVGNVDTICPSMEEKDRPSASDDKTDLNMPKYLAVYMWERTA